MARLQPAYQTPPPTRNRNPFRGPVRQRDLIDPENVESQVGPDDLAYADYLPDTHDQDVIKLAQQRVVRAQSYRRIKEPTFFESLAFYLGNQGVRWDYMRNCLQPVQATTPALKGKVYTTRNKIRPKIKKLIYRSFSQSPDASVKPRTSSDIDRAAAQEAAAILTHLDYKFNRPSQTKTMGHWALTTSTTALKIYWDPKALVEVPIMGDSDTGSDETGAGSPALSGVGTDTDDDRDIIGERFQPNGDICEDIVPIFEMLFDPEARDIESCAWIVHQKTRSLEYIRDKYPQFGRCVRPNAGLGPSGYVESRLATVIGEYTRGSEPAAHKANCAVVNEIWERPSELYPKGRYIVESNGVKLVELEKWPNMDARVLQMMRVYFPFAFLSYEQASGSLYALNAVQDLIPAQRSLNNTISRIEEHRNTAWGKLLIQENSGVPKGAFNDALPNEIITYRQGMEPPQHIAAPDLPTWLMEMRQADQLDIDDMSGLHEVFEGNTPPGVDSGIAIAKLQGGDNMMGSDFAGNIEEFHRVRAMLEIHVFGQNALGDQLLNVSTGYFGDPAKKFRVPGLGGGAIPPPAPPTETTIQGQPSAALPPTPSVPPPIGAQPPPQVPSAAPQGVGANSLPSAAPPPSPPQQPLDLGSDEPDAMTQVKAFKALQSGGSCHVVVVPGSALARDPDAERQEAIQLFKLGVFGPPGDPAATGILLGILEMSGADEIVQAVQHALDERMILASMAQPQQSNQESAQQHELDLTNAKIAAAQATEQAKQAHEGAIVALKSHADQLKIQMETQAAQALAEQKAQFDTHVAMLARLHPEIRVTGTLTPQGEASFERSVGLDSPTPAQADAEHTATYQPPTPPVDPNIAEKAQHQSQLQAQSAQQQLEAQQAQAEAQADAAGTDDSTDNTGE